MVAIGDKFGKASKSNQYAPATTVKTARIAGVTVLETFDLTKYPTDTPLFFVTYKKTIDPVTSEVSIINQVSYKGLVNDVSNTITNLTVAPGYTDLGNDVGDFVEAIPTSYWETSLIDGLLTSINPDGTLKTSAVQAALNISGSTTPDWSLLANTPSVTDSNLARKRRKLTFTGVDYTDRLAPGMSLRIPRTGTTPTKSVKMTPASNHWAAKTSPANISGNIITVEAIVVLTSYKKQYILSRFNSSAETAGFGFNMEDDGRLRLLAGTTSGFDTAIAASVVPINRPVHLAMAIDVAAGTSAAWIDGDPVQTFFTNTASTTITQGGDLAIGRGGVTASNTQFLDGTVFEVRLWNTVRTTQQIRDNMGKQLVGNESGLMGYWKLDNDFNDSTANANNLTANGGLLVNNNYHQFKAVEYGKILKVEKPASDTIVTIATGIGVLSNVSLSPVSYSSARSPYGMPTDLQVDVLGEDLAIPHRNSLFFATGGTGGGRVISTQVYADFDTSSADANGITVTNYGSAPYMTILRDGWYDINAQLYASDASGGPFTVIIWFSVSYDNGATTNLLRTADRAITIGTSQQYSQPMWLPAGTRVSLQYYAGGGAVRYAAPDSTMNARQNFGTKLSVTEIL